MCGFHAMAARQLTLGESNESLPLIPVVLRLRLPVIVPSKNIAIKSLAYEQFAQPCLIVLEHA